MSVNGAHALELLLHAPDGATHKPAGGMNVRVYVYIAIAAIANVLFGYETSVISGAKTDFGHDHPLSDLQTGILVAGNPAGATVGAAIAGILQDRFGRRVTLIAACAAYIGAVMVSFTSEAFPQLAAGRLFTGFTIGIFSSTVPMYIAGERTRLDSTTQHRAVLADPFHSLPTPRAELSPGALRGTLLTINQTCICVGILLGFVSNMLLSPHWKWELFCAAPLAGLLLLLFLLVTPFR